MSKDGLTDHEREMGCTISEVMPQGVERVHSCNHYFKNGKCIKCGITSKEFESAPDQGGTLSTGTSSKIHDAEWIGPPKGQIEPIKEVQADVLAVQNNFKTLEEVLLEQGRELNATLKQVEIEKDLQEEMGIMPITAAAENQFKTIFFQNGDYDLPGMMISSINMVSGILKKENGYKFLVWQNGDDAESPSVFSYGSLDQAQGDRVNLIQQIEAFHSRGMS